MRRITMGSLLLGMAFALLAGASAPPPVKTEEKPDADAVEYLYMASDRPVRIRFQVRLGGNAYNTNWNEWMDKMFAWFDTNKDGQLDSKEVARIVQANFLSTMIQGAITGQQFTPVPMTAVDTNRDGKVTKEEFRAYYAKNGLPALNYQLIGNLAMTAKNVNEQIYKRLDTNGDGKLSKEELSRMQIALRSMDENEDEVLTLEELNPQGGGGNPFFVPSTRAAQGPVVEPALIEYEIGKPNMSRASELMKHYDKNKDGRLSMTEIGFEKPLFERLDRNRDGSLDVSELSQWFAVEPDLHFKLHVGQFTRVSGILDSLGFGSYRTQQRLQIVPTENRDLSKKVRRQSAQSAAMTFGDTQLTLDVQSGATDVRLGSRPFYLQQFNTVAGKNDYVTREQLKTNQNPFVSSLFTQADRDADDKLTKKELIDWLDIVQFGAGSAVNLQVTDQGRNLFGVLNTRKDGRLSIRQMRNSWASVAPLCKIDPTGITEKDLPRQLSISVHQGQGNGFVPPVLRTGQPVTSVPSFLQAAVPAWFRKMDRNMDNDISPKEWLGTEEEFRAIDTDRDGLISVAEAQRFERTRGKKK